MTDLAVSALVRRHAELAGEIEAAEARLDQLRADLVHLHAAIRIMDPAPTRRSSSRSARTARAALSSGTASWAARCWTRCGRPASH
jgi:hypothetical protein